jgi:RNA polymerase sigma factor
MLVQKRFFSFSTFSVRQDKNDVLGNHVSSDDVFGNDVSGNLASMQIYNREEEEQNLRLEIEAVNDEFSKWGFSWAGLLKKCPKQKRSRLIALRAAHAIREDSALLAETLKNRQLPLARLAETFPRKALEKYRHYIVALVILLQGDYPYVYSFLPQEQL